MRREASALLEQRDVASESVRRRLAAADGLAPAGSTSAPLSRLPKPTSGQRGAKCCEGGVVAIGDDASLAALPQLAHRGRVATPKMHHRRARGHRSVSLGQRTDEGVEEQRLAARAFD